MIREGSHVHVQFYWEIVTHFGNFSCSNWEKKILFGRFVEIPEHTKTPEHTNNQ